MDEDRYVGWRSSGWTDTWETPRVSPEQRSPFAFFGWHALAAVTVAIGSPFMRLGAWAYARAQYHRPEREEIGHG